MARIENIELPKEKRIVIGLTYIYGIGRNLAEKICDDAKVDQNIKVKDLTTEQENKLRTEVAKVQTGGDLKREVQMNIKTKMEIKSYQGIRHKKKLPVRGQKTKTNARTHKGKPKTVAKKKK